MFTDFTKEEKAIHYPTDRRTFISVKPYMKVIFAILILAPIGAAWLQYVLIGLPNDSSSALPSITPGNPTGFPRWLNLSHWVNFFFLTLIIRSGLSILADHPRLYWNNGCTPGTDWIRFTPYKKPEDKSWTAKEDARYISPAFGLPGYRQQLMLRKQKLLRLHWL